MLNYATMYITNCAKNYIKMGNSRHSLIILLYTFCKTIFSLDFNT